MGVRELAEGIILQSIDDLSSKELRGDAVGFLSGSNFALCARLAELDQDQQGTLMQLVYIMLDDSIETQRYASPVPATFHYRLCQRTN